MPRFFLSYRRDDNAGFAGRLADALETAFGVGSVFRDVDDIQPGEDFVEAINRQLQSAHAMLVMIGPHWLEAGADSGRRLDAADDFVRREVAAGLASGKPVIPLLLGGAAMPDGKDLPDAIASLARHQAMVLSDADWRTDVERLVARLRELAPEAHDAKPGFGRARLIVAAVAIVVVGVFAALRFVPATTTSEPVAHQAAVDLSGRWSARVKYDWGDQHDEVFAFKNLANALHGTASFEGGRLTIEQAKLEGEWLSFVTRSLESISSGGEPKEVTHHYIGQVTPESIRFTLEISGGYSVHTPVEFVAKRDGGSS